MSTNYSNLICDLLKKREDALFPEEIAAKIGLSAGDLSDFMLDLTRLEKDSVVFATRRGKYFMPNTAGLVKADIISMHKNFSFARPKEEGEDVFVHNRNLRGALMGDTVLLRVRGNSAKGPEGMVERVLTRGTHEFTGRLVKVKHGFEIEPMSGIRFNIPVERGTKKKLYGGERVKAQLVNKRQKGGADTYFAKILRVYGDADSARVCSDAVIDMAGIPTSFPPVVKAQAKVISENGIPAEEYIGRVDLRDEPIFTIDSAEAKDLDDAVSIKSRPDGGWQLGVHIADVSHYVQAGTPMDKEALLRGTSVYFADRVIPMLPQALSNGLCSLNGGEDRLAFSAVIELNKNAEMMGYKFFKSVICSKVRGVYSEINSILDGSAADEIVRKYSVVGNEISEMSKCARKLKERAVQRGTLEIQTNESKIILDENGVACDILPRARGESEEMIEQFMICANVAAAKLALEKGVPFVYRTHESPRAQRLEDLKETAELFGFQAKRINIDSTSADLADLLKQARGTKYEKVLSEETLRTMAKAKYTTQCTGHYGLALENYSHFTSPIRRYPDLSIHRILTDLVGGKTQAELEKKYSAFVTRSAEASTDCEIRAMNAERDCEDCYKAEYMRAFIGETFEGVISSAAAHGIYVELANSVEGMIRPEALPGVYHYDGKASFVSQRGGSKFTVGDAVKIVVVRADVSSGQIDFELAD